MATSLKFRLFIRAIIQVLFKFPFLSSSPSLLIRSAIPYFIKYSATLLCHSLSLFGLQFHPIHSLLSQLVHSPLCLYFKIKRFYTFLSMSSLKLTVIWIWKELQCNWQSHIVGRQQESRSLTWKLLILWSGALSPIRVFVRLQALALSNEWQLMQCTYWYWLTCRPRAPSCGQHGVCSCRSVGALKIPGSLFTVTHNRKTYI